jgi:carboxyl-terminal processing protease
VLRRCRLIAEVFQHRPNADDGQTRDTQRAEWMNQINGFQFEVEGEKDGLSKEQFVTLLDQVLSANASTIRIPPAVLLAQLAQGAFDPLDPYTRIVWPGEATAFEEQISQRYTGVGVNLIKAEDGLRVVEIVPNSPAYIGGIRQDDRIVAINGASTETMTLDDAIGEITGPSGTAVKLGVKRAPSNQTEEIALERELITVMTVKGLTTDPTSTQRYWLEPREGIAYLRITQFTESTPEQTTQALEVLGPGVKGLVLDLRYNAGGSVLSAVHVADLFISKGLIARCQGRLGPSTYYCADADDALADRPMVVLINKSSASAAEIVAGALQRTKPHRAVLVGEPTFGKTCVQTITPFPGGGSFLKYTSANWYLAGQSPVANDPSRANDDASIRQVVPDVECRLTVEEQRQLLASWFRGGIERKGLDTAPSDTNDIDTPIDAQLAAGLMILKTQLIQANLPPDPSMPIQATRIAQRPMPESLR